MTKIYKYLPLKVKILFYVSIILAILDPLFFMIQPFFTEQFIQMLADPNRNEIFLFKWKIVVGLNPILVLSLLTFGTSAITFGNMFLGFYISSKMSILAAYHLRKQCFEHLLSLSKKEIDKISYSTIITRFTNDINKIQDGMLTITRSVIVSPGFIIIGTIFSLITSTQLSISLAISIPLLIFGASFLVFKVFPLYRKENYLIDNLNADAKESINGISLIKSYNLEKHFHKKYNNKNNEYLLVMKKELKIGIWLWKYIDFIFSLNTSIIFIIAGLIMQKHNNIEGSKILGSVYKFTIFTAMISHGVIRSFFTINWAFRTSISAKRFDELMQIKSSIQYPQNNLKITKGIIEFKNVSFTYPKSTEGVKNLNFTIQPGQFIGIVGAIGSGKSTITKLLTRQYLPNQGNIYIDNVNINEIDSKNFYDQISLVFQDSIILSGTIDSNLNLSYENNLEDKWKDKIKNLSNLEYIEQLEQGYNHPISQRGSNLSGGQKQRLAIARAIAKQPKILILDDATSSLDNNTDALIRQNLIKEFKDITIIMISQRISSIKNANQILVMKNGEIENIGTHDELLYKSVEYNKINNSQKEKNE